MDQACDQGVTCTIDGISFTLRESEDFSWLHSYGTVFSVNDRQTSGNLCFGVSGPYGRLFIKYAGAKTMRFHGKPEDAVAALRQAMPLYRHTHPSLTTLLNHGPIHAGYAAIFAWMDLPVLRTYPPDDTIRNQLRALPLSRSLRMLDGVFSLHCQLAEDGYVAIDFWDGNVLLDFQHDRAVICDIDLYQKKPVVNSIGIMPGSSRFRSPEEYTFCATVDECSNVFAMGALAFEFYGSNNGRSREDWFAPEALYAVASKATQEKREMRYPTLAAFLQAWREAVGACDFA